MCCETFRHIAGGMMKGRLNLISILLCDGNRGGLKMSEEQNIKISFSLAFYKPLEKKLKCLS